jgi:MFS family permease
MFLNYLDRGSLSVAAPVLASDLAISPSQLGLLLSAFFWTYAIGQIPAGWLVDRYPVQWVYGIGFFVWAAATIATGWISGFASLFVCRLALGVGESVAYPACSRILARGVPEERRGVANAWIDAATKAGPALSMLLGGLLVDGYGWRMLFFAAGGLSLLWLPFWIGLYRETGAAAAQRPQEPEPVPFSEILARPEAWGTSLGMFALGYVWYFLLTWMPTYLAKGRGFDMKSTAILGSLPLAAMALSTMGFAWLSDRRIASGASVTGVRRTFLIAGLLVTALLLPPAALVADGGMAVALLTAGYVSLGMFTANCWATTQTLAGPSAAGRWTGIQNAVGNLGGVISPWLTGIVVEHTGSYVPAFAAAALVGAAGAGCYRGLVPKVEPLVWARGVK